MTDHSFLDCTCDPETRIVHTDKCNFDCEHLFCNNCQGIVE